MPRKDSAVYLEAAERAMMGRHLYASSCIAKAADDLRYSLDLMDEFDRYFSPDGATFFDWDEFDGASERCIALLFMHHIAKEKK